MHVLKAAAAVGLGVQGTKHMQQFEEKHHENRFHG